MTHRVREKRTHAHYAYIPWVAERVKHLGPERRLELLVVLVSVYIELARFAVVPLPYVIIQERETEV